MEKFNITRATKRDLAREIKKEINDRDYSEFAIMYAPPNFRNDGHFFVSETFNRENSEQEGNVFYKLFTHSKADGKITLKEIEAKIFG